MQPLKRFTQCGSLTMLFGVFIVLFGVSSTALTTFGKSNPNNPPPQPTTPPIKARECTNHGDCATIQHTSCVMDTNDDKLRCLCGDNRPPINGYCAAKTKSLRHVCSDITQCEDGMICGIDNATRTIALGIKSPVDNTKVCLCNEEVGFVEKNHVCSGTVPLFTGILTPLASVLLGYLLSQRQMQY